MVNMGKRGAVSLLRIMSPTADGTQAMPELPHNAPRLSEIQQMRHATRNPSA
jgi:hypothetical protein